jgi:hypothetical protein
MTDVRTLLVNRLPSSQLPLLVLLPTQVTDWIAAIQHFASPNRVPIIRGFRSNREERAPAVRRGDSMIGG